MKTLSAQGDDSAALLGGHLIKIEGEHEFKGHVAVNLMEVEAGLGRIREVAQCVGRSTDKLTAMVAPNVHAQLGQSEAAMLAQNVGLRSELNVRQVGVAVTQQYVNTAPVAAASSASR